MVKKISMPLTCEKVTELKFGDTVLLSGTIYAARDEAHKRFIELLDDGKNLPIDIKDSIIYYTGPTPAKPGQTIGSAGPTTSRRMDCYTPRLLDIGLRGMIGKGSRSSEVIESMIKNGAVYFAAIGGAAVLTAKSIIKSELTAYEDLGPEAVRKLEVIDLPLIVAIDYFGNDLYKTGRLKYRESQK